MSDSSAGVAANATSDVLRRVSQPTRPLREKTAERIASEFSAAELQELIALYESPLVKRLQDTQSRVLAESREEVLKRITGPLDSLRKKLLGEPPDQEPWR